MSVVRHIIVRGRVQGVGYRAWVEDQALRLGLEGWVRNRRDGAVEAVLSGADTAVAQMVESCRRGPSAARVDTVDSVEGAQGLLDRRRAGERFSVLATA